MAKPPHGTLHGQFVKIIDRSRRAHRASRVARIGIDRVEAISGDRYLRLATNT